MVEGLFDAIALHQLGFPETVAVLGSGLSEGQALLLKKAGVLEVYLAFDADEAGQKATLQSLNLELAPRFLFYAVRLPAKDPGELLLHPEGRALFQKALEEALPEVAFRFEEASRGLDLSRPEHKRKVLEALTPRMLTPEPFDPVAERLKALVVERLGLSPKSLEDYLASLRTRGRPAPPPTAPTPHPRQQDPPSGAGRHRPPPLRPGGALPGACGLRGDPGLAPGGFLPRGVPGPGPEGAPAGPPPPHPKPAGGRRKAL